jgi:hypothetical protein
LICFARIDFSEQSHIKGEVYIYQIILPLSEYVGRHPELSTGEGKQPSQVDISGSPPPKKAIIVYCQCSP